jgi:hypothetical protein
MAISDEISVGYESECEPKGDSVEALLEARIYRPVTVISDGSTEIVVIEKNG